jgi:hypothetical protein
MRPCGSQNLIEILISFSEETQKNWGGFSTAKDPPGVTFPTIQKVHPVAFSLFLTHTIA